MRRRTGSLLPLTIAAFLGVTTTAGAWQPPIGIPMPPFGINEVAPPVPNPWTGPVAGFYYVDQTHPASTDSGNPYGWPAKPRYLIPTRLPAGSVVQVAGRYDWTHDSPYDIIASGTPTQPVFIQGVPGVKAVQNWTIHGSYTIVENMVFADRDGVLAGGLVFASFQGVGSDHMAVRHSLFTGNANGGGVGSGSYDSGNCDYIVFWDNVIHDTGDPNAATDIDAGALVIGANSHHIWIVDNESYRNGRDGFGFNQGSGVGWPLTGLQYIYVGRNKSHHNRQGGFAIKEGSDFIFSQNVAWASPPNSGSRGHGFIAQYNPQRVWYLFNTVFDSDRGIEAPDVGVNYIIGNLIYNIHHTINAYAPTYDPNDPYDGQTGQAIYRRNSQATYIINNTMVDVDAGIGGINNPEMHIVNNIIANRNGMADGAANARHIHLENINSALSEVRNNILEGSNVRISWNAGTPVYTLAQFQAAYPAVASGNLNVDPQFVDPAARDFRLRSTSPAVDKGLLSSVYATFKSLYGIDIAKDIAGIPRPQGPAADIGAFELSSRLWGDPPASPTGLIVQ